MKTLTCREMGGPCETPITGDTFQEMMDNGAAHITELASQDEGHAAAVKMMDDASKNPEMAKMWEDKFREAFDAAPDA